LGCGTQTLPGVYRALLSHSGKQEVPVPTSPPQPDPPGGTLFTRRQARDLAALGIVIGGLGCLGAAAFMVGPTAGIAFVGVVLVAVGVLVGLG
jgi:hypothetical protein